MLGILKADAPGNPNHWHRGVRGHWRSAPARPPPAWSSTQRVPSGDDSPVMGGTATPPLGVTAGHVWGAGGTTGAQVLKASFAKAAVESAGAKTHDEVNGTVDTNANGEVQKEVEIAA